MIVQIFNTTREKRLPQKKLARLVKYILVSENKNFDVNVILTGSSKIQSLNKAYRNQDKPTDVLSFVPEDSDEPPPFKPVGEIYISIPVARRQARRAGHSLTHELLFLASHGSLHLCGYTHETDAKYRAMMAASESALERLGY